MKEIFYLLFLSINLIVFASKPNTEKILSEGQLLYRLEKASWYNTLTTTYHSYIVTDCITSTDICTLLLNKDFVEWKQHYVLSKNRSQYSIWSKKSWQLLQKTHGTR